MGLYSMWIGNVGLRGGDVVSDCIATKLEF